MLVKGITRRWLYNSLSIISIVFVVLIVSFAFILKGYYYSGVEQMITEKAIEITNVFKGSAVESHEKFKRYAEKYVQSFSSKDKITLAAFDHEDAQIASSAGAEAEDIGSMPDYNIAKTDASNFGLHTARPDSGGHFMYATKCIYGEDGQYMGAFRYSISLSNIDTRIFTSVVLLFMVAILVTVFVILSGIYFMRAIVSPIREIKATTQRIAMGDFNAKIDNRYDDEIGELCDTINYMAGELKVAEKMKNDFISSVSHELRTPLTAIKGWAETMQLSENIEKSTMEKGLQIIISESERLSGIVEELLDISSMQSGRMVLKMDKIDILAELDEAVYMFKEQAAAEEKTLLYEEPKMVSPVFGDRNRLRQVFVNIIDNSLKYTEKNATIIIQIKEEGDKLRITVADNGCGVSADDLPRIKEKFYKANQTQRGSGIGLAVANEIIRLHSGDLAILSEEGIGTVVTISIPLMNAGAENTD